MKCVFSISLLASLTCLTTWAQAHDTFSDGQIILPLGAVRKRKPSEQRHPDASVSKPSKNSTPVEKKDEAPTSQIPVVTIKTVEEVIKDTTDKNKMAQFGIAAMLKSFKEQAANTKNPDNIIFERDAAIGAEIVASTKSLEQAKHLVLKLDKRTQKALLAAIKQYPIFKQRGVADEFFKARA